MLAILKLRNKIIVFMIFYWYHTMEKTIEWEKIVLSDLYRMVATIGIGVYGGFVVKLLKWRKIVIVNFYFSNRDW